MYCNTSALKISIRVLNKMRREKVYLYPYAILYIYLSRKYVFFSDHIFVILLMDCVIIDNIKLNESIYKLLIKSEDYFHVLKSALTFKNMKIIFRQLRIIIRTPKYLEGGFLILMVCNTNKSDDKTNKLICILYNVYNKPC